MRLISSFAICFTLSSFASVAGDFYPNNAQHAVSLSFDDARRSQADVGLPILDKHNVKGTFYLMPVQMKGKEAKWQAAAKAGHEIANHSASHLCTGNFRWLREKNKGLEQVDLPFIEKDIQTAQQQIEQITGVAPVGYAYPCGHKFVGRGESVQSYVPLIAKSFEYGRTWNDETANDPHYYDTAQIRAFDIDNKSFEEIKAIIERAKFDDAWIVLAGHEVGDRALYTIDSKALDQLIVYLKDPKNGFWLAPVAEVNQYIQQKRTR
ncbi:MAG: polysaccharide deacetylase family protein [Pseudoalteromonas spongiae]